MTNALQKAKKFLFNDVMCVIFLVCFLIFSDNFLDIEPLRRILYYLESGWILLVLFFIKVDHLSRKIDALIKKFDEEHRR